MKTISVSSSFSSQKEFQERQKLIEYFNHCPIPDEHLLSNLALFINRKSLTRILFMHELYTKMLSTLGVIMEFGVRWGQNLALFESFRGIYEPYNHSRKIVGFDTFEGFCTIDPKDGVSDHVSIGAMSVTDNYQEFLEKLLTYHETESPIAHIKKFEIIQGDASVTVKKYLEKQPETIIALAYFDMDVYEPTLQCLQKIKPHLTKGSIIGFDQLNSCTFPGETRAFQEVLGSMNYRLQNSRFGCGASYIIFE